MELRQVVIALGPEWKDRTGKLEAGLFAEKVRCVRPDGGQIKNWKDQIRKTEKTEALQQDDFSAADTVVITDNRTLAAALAERGFVCIGCDDGGDEFFEGAVLVTDTPGVLDVRTLEECLLRGTGRPVTIAVTDRLTIREITERDIPGLRRIGRQDGTRRAMEDADGDCFEPERLRAYIRHVYRIFGYGLWSVLLRDGTLIGSCGFKDYTESGSTGKESRGSSLCLELQYAVAEEYRRQGYGEEMCRAALEYARRRLHADRIWIRVKPDNRASRALAERLGFRLVSTDAAGTELYSFG